MYVERVVWSWLLLSAFSPGMANAVPFLEGTVTDEQGRPIAGVSVKVWDCVGTCLGGKTVLTDDEGHYAFAKKPFQNSPLLAIDLPGRYEMSRKQTGPDLHDEDTATPRRVDFVLGTPAAAVFELEGETPEGWKQKLVIRAGRDAELHRYDFHPTFEPDWDEWTIDLLPRNENLHLVMVREPVVEQGDDSKVMRERERESRRQRVEIISPAFKLVDPQRHHVRARIVSSDDGGEPRMAIDSVKDGLGNDRTEELTEKDSQFGPSVDNEARDKALELLERVKEAAAPWNVSPLTQVDAYEYDFIDCEESTTHVKLDRDSPEGPAWSDIARLRGFAYMPPLRWLFSQPDNMVFHGVAIDEERAVLHYRLKEERGFAAGLGIGPGWNGFFTRSFASGTIVIDVKTATVLEHRLSRGPLDKESVETFSDYVTVGEGYAPRSLRIQSGDFDLRLKFRIHGDTLWLLEQAYHGDEVDPALEIENVKLSLID